MWVKNLETQLFNIFFQFLTIQNSFYTFLLTVTGSSSRSSISARFRKTFPLDATHSILSKAGSLSRLITPAMKPSWPPSSLAFWESMPWASPAVEKKACVFSKTYLSSVNSRKLDFRLTAFSESSLMSLSVFSMCA